MDLKAIIYVYLDERNFDGLFNPDLCCCKKDDLMPCEEPDVANCQPGYIQKCYCDSDYPDTCPNGWDMCIGKEKTICDKS